MLTSIMAFLPTVTGVVAWHLAAARHHERVFGLPPGPDRQARAAASEHMTEPFLNTSFQPRSRTLPFQKLALTTSLLGLLTISGSALAADHVVKMLNAGKDGTMVFEPSFIKVAVGDTVVFAPTEKAAHNSASVLLPEGAKPWKGAADTEIKVKIEKEGVYLYACEPHKVMGMVGVIQAGKPVNLALAKAAAAKEQATFAMGKDRFDKALARVK